MRGRTIPRPEDLPTRGATVVLPAEPRAEPGAANFAAVLRTAITERGLSLERIRQHLAVRGVTISLATLSYWQTGRSQPERRSSLAALTHLEQVLLVAPGTLSRLLRAPAQRADQCEPPTFSSLWPRPAAVEHAVEGVVTAWDDRLTRISQHDIVVVGAERGERSYRSRQVLRAEADGPDRWVVVLHLDEHDHELPRVRGLRNCSLGRTVTRPASGLLVAELLFPDALRRGETIIIEHEMVNKPPLPTATNYERKFRLPVREYALEIRFDGASPPATCERYVRTSTGEERARKVVPRNGSVHTVALDYGPGCLGFRWTW
jgi:hypothetical protein